MRIKRLKLSGFKSFVEPTELKIRDGLTGIVGPNGCGKSNLLEALRWVMGESSPKSVRGSGMEDVIFAGTENRPAREFAEVSLLAERDSGGEQPAFIANDDDSEIEVTRRIERGAGSAYRANGRDVRAKDVALIFADAATGAHSPALVSQGRIGTIISAKPQERRQMLEEAAGISGLHVRRKDAEQKLRAAESNLEKLSVMLGDMDARASQLKRQARQAERYKKLSEDITQGEARLIFVKWRAAKAAADAAKALAASAASEVEKASVSQATLSNKQQEATGKLASDRTAAMAARDAARDLSEKIITQRGEADRIRQRLSDMESQAARIADDSQREDRLTHSAADALDQLKTENETLTAAIQMSDDALPALDRAVADAEKSLRDNELELAQARTAQAKAEADQRVAKAALNSAEQQLQRLQNEAERLDADRQALGDEDSLRKDQTQAEAQRDAAQDKAAGAEATLNAIGDKRQTLIAARDAAQNTLADARAHLAAIRSEQAALEKALRQSSDDKAIDQVKAEKGFEHALAAALGEDADAPIGGDSGRRWGFVDDGGANIKGSEAENLLVKYVDAPAELTARLARVQVADSDDGRSLKPGERLVTRDGRMRRWDGFISENDGATHAERLVRTNRLQELNELSPPAEQQVSAAEASLNTAAQAITALTEEQAQAEQAREEASGELRTALREVDRSADALERLKQARGALQERSRRSDEEIKSAQAAFDLAQEQVAALPDAGTQDDVVGTLQTAGETMRQALVTAQSALSTHGQSAAQQKERRAVVQSEIRSWQERAGEAEKRIAEMKRRSVEIAEEQSALADKPAEIDGQLGQLEQDRSTLNEKLAALQSTEEESEASLKALEAQLAEAAEALSSAREERAGAAARAENEEARRIEMGRISGERFECPPPVLPERQKFDEEDLGDSDAESSRLDQLQASRERIGPVNLIAADELSELEKEHASGLAESEELTLAINQLRGSIGSLNREGRQRLLEAFEAVDQHFRRLFATLFNGGQAHLALIDSDDPLEAGLEIYAQPPGKKLQSLTLLSGGEQALTAVALIFALFLTNPAPICVLDEVDAPLDDANIERFCDLLDAMSRETDTRYMIVTHNAVTMSRMHRLFGVTMIEQGVSRLVSVDLGAAEELLAAE